MKKIIPSICALLLLASSPADAQLFGLFGKSPAQKIKDALDAVGREYDLCGAAYEKDPALAPIADKLPITSDKATLRQMTDDTKPSETEVAALYALYDKRQACRSAAVDKTSKVAPTLANIFREQFAKVDRQYIALVQRKISWGEYVVVAKDISAETQKNITAESVRIEEGLQRDQQAEYARWNQALQQSIQNDQNQKLIDAVGSGGSSTGTVNCRTVAIGGGMARTQCY